MDRNTIPGVVVAKSSTRPTNGNNYTKQPPSPALPVPSAISKWGGVMPGVLEPATPNPYQDPLPIPPEEIDDYDNDGDDTTTPRTASLNPRTFLTQEEIDITNAAEERRRYYRQRARQLAVVLRVEFDPNCVNLSYVEKAKLAGIEGSSDDRIAYKYHRILNSVDFIAKRRIALYEFESEMDVATALCLATAAKVDPQVAIMRRRLRQMDERRQVGGDQREQFARLMEYLHGEIDTLPLKGDNNNGKDTSASGVHTGTSGLGQQDNEQPDGLVQARSAISERREGEEGEVEGNDGRE